ncbi:N-acetylglucosaminyldiphosphodolichol N-acetylglucosaminyltransferase Alg13 [Mycotypha africana]|uniref:N-acetylglucosaminyldiphosphodolichol N-acetylglucosaminyltransferase Alg13 n=1 Tax=Mycotypha africana TaxID=64632 RepID=UPI002300B98F|nr:N-acetylglucosaminyldiphosphodolichol N-acetylglucosaminyltransferase Alg13 [Mycotypha africana]KAI8970341.1 N-acetylglucosaminyldiphosphodolichol N-acetylglucosaminyltransferase Alg13 [Mycotypha africana]
MALFVTVGSTGFDELIRETTSPAFLDLAYEIGLKAIVYQYGSSREAFNDNIACYEGKLIDIVGYDYKPSITEDMEKSDIVISHAGAGTILQALRLKHTKLIMVVNASLMNNHQLELAEAIESQRYAVLSEPRDLLKTLKHVNSMNFTPFNDAEPDIFASIVDQQMGFD